MDVGATKTFLPKKNNMSVVSTSCKTTNVVPRTALAGSYLVYGDIYCIVEFPILALPLQT